jgi:two-component system NtrC family sensor kinase
MFGTYNYQLVLMSYIVAVMSSYIGLDLIGKLHSEQNIFIKYVWITGGAIVMGSGIWSMHFIGMLAYIMPMNISYDSLWTGISLLAAILGSSVAFFILRKPEQLFTLIIGGILMGIAIVLMHYLGMQAMESGNEIKILYQPSWFLLSIIVAILASEAAIWCALKSNKGPLPTQLKLKILSSLVMGAAICGMHYIAMKAAIFLPLEQHSEHVGNTIQTESLALYIALIISLITFVSLIISTQRQLILTSMQSRIALADLRKIEISHDLLETEVKQRTDELEKKNTELSHAINNLKMMQKNLIQTENMAIVGQLASGIAHEINNPLAYITNNMTALEKTSIVMQKYIDLVNKLSASTDLNISAFRDELHNFNLNNKLHKDMNDIKNIISESHEGLSRIKNIVTNLGQFAEKNFDQMDDLNINDCIESALEIIHNQLKYKCTVYKNFQKLPKIKGSYKQLQIVFINILLNAVQSIEDKGEIWINTQLKDDQVAITIKDTGCGIEKDKIEKIFNPFFSTKKIGEGTGLGLTTSYNIIKNHHGIFTIDSEIDKGSIFTIYLVKNST